MFKVTWARLCVFGRMHDRVQVLDVRTAECKFSYGCATRLWCTDWSGRVCAWTRPRFGRDTQIGCVRAKLYGYD